MGACLHQEFCDPQTKNHDHGVNSDAMPIFPSSLRKVCERCPTTSYKEGTSQLVRIGE